MIENGHTNGNRIFPDFASFILISFSVICVSKTPLIIESSRITMFFFLSHFCDTVSAVFLVFRTCSVYVSPTCYLIEETLTFASLLPLNSLLPLVLRGFLSLLLTTDIPFLFFLFHLCVFSLGHLLRWTSS